MGGFQVRPVGKKVVAVTRAAGRWLYRHGERLYRRKRIEYNFAYERMTIGGLCVYCGDHATDEDHVPPIAAVNRLGPHGQMVLVASCDECNTLAGSLHHTTVSERCIYLEKRIRQRYRNLVLAAEWSAEELAELGPNIRQHIECTETQARKVRRRLEMLAMGRSGHAQKKSDLANV